jgi:hypothetical protein
MVSGRGLLPLGRGWIGVTALGWSVGLALGWPLGLLLSSGLPAQASLASIGLVSGAIVGLGQSFLPRRHGMPTDWWIASTSLAAAFSFFLGCLVLMLPPAIAVTGLLAGAVGGVITGLLLAGRHLLPGSRSPG